MSSPDSKLTDFPYRNPGYGRKVAVIGVGSAGCRITYQLSKQNKLLEHFVYFTCDDQDVANVTLGEKILVDALSKSKETPYEVRGLVAAKLPELRRSLADSELAIIISGLGGAVGSGLAPLVAREAKEKGIATVAVVVMPFAHEKQKHFFAGGALNQLRNYTSGLILIDNDELLETKGLPAIDAYSLVNQKIALALNKLLGSTEESEFGVGLTKVVDFLKTKPKSYTVLCLGEENETSQYRNAVFKAANHFDNIVDKRQASKSIVHIIGDKSMTMNEIVNSVGSLSGLLGDGTMQIEYGFSANSAVCSAAVIVATGFPTTRFDDYDPVDKALRSEQNMEPEFDSSLGVDLFMKQLERE